AARDVTTAVRATPPVLEALDLAPGPARVLGCAAQHDVGLRAHRGEAVLDPLAWAACGQHRDPWASGDGAGAGVGSGAGASAGPGAMVTLGPSAAVLGVTPSPVAR